MRPITPSRRQAEEFAAAVDGRSASGVPPEETVAFLALVAQLRDLDGPRPAVDFSTDLRTRLVAAAEAELVTDPSPPRDRPEDVVVPSARPARRHRVVPLIATTCIVTSVTTGVAVASESALPGEALYPVKRSIERVEVSMTRNAADRGHELLDQAGTRLAEIRGLAETKADDPTTPALISDTLDDFNSQSREGGQLLLSSFEQQADAEVIVELRAFADDATTQLGGLARSLPTELRSDLTLAGTSLAGLDSLALEACSTCSDLDPLTLPGTLVDPPPDQPAGTGVVGGPQSAPDPAPATGGTTGGGSPQGAVNPNVTPGALPPAGTAADNGNAGDGATPPPDLQPPPQVVPAPPDNPLPAPPEVTPPPVDETPPPAPVPTPPDVTEPPTTLPAPPVPAPPPVPSPDVVDPTVGGLLGLDPPSTP